MLELHDYPDVVAELAATYAEAPPSALRVNVLAALSSIPQEAAAPEPPSLEAPRPPTDESVSGESAGGLAPVVPLNSKRPARRPIRWILVAAAAAVAVIFGVWQPWAPSQPGIDQVLAAADAKTYQQQLGDAKATVVVSREMGLAVLTTDNMPPPPAGKEYQVWLQQPGKGMVGAGGMPQDAATTHRLLLKGDSTTATAVGVTVEPEGGSPQPTTNPVVLLSLS